MCAPDAPDPPDYAAAATAQGDANKEAAIASAMLSNPNYINPYGTREVIYDWGTAPVTPSTTTPTATPTGTSQSNLPGIFNPMQELAAATSNGSTPTSTFSPSATYSGGLPYGIPGITVRDTLSPAEQAKLEANNKLALGLLGTAQTGLDRVDQTFKTPFDSSNLPAITTPMGPAGLQQVSDALLQRLEPQFERQRDLLRTQAVNQGFDTGSEGYNETMDQHNRTLNDARLAALAQAQQAASTSYGMEADARSKAMQEAAWLRNLPLSEVNALRTGNQPTTPQFQPYQGQSTQAAPIFNAAQAQYAADLGAYNADAASSGNFMSGLFSLGGSALASPWLMSSDRRLKKNIQRIGTHDLGIGVYKFEYLNGSKAIGVMADEVEAVKPEAVLVDANGYKMVNYDLL